MGVRRTEHKQARGWTCALSAGLTVLLMAVGLTAMPARAATPPSGTSGALDLSFGTDGVTTISVPGLDLVAVTRAIVQPDGKILVGGVQPGVAASVTVVRLLPTGQLDATFGSGSGYVRTSVGTGATEDGAQLALQPDGKIIVAGGSSLRYQITVQRLLANGAPDNTFGTASVTRPHYFDSANSGLVRATGVVLQPDGKIVVSVWSGKFERLAAARFSSSGVLDKAFAGDGIAEAEIKVGNQKRTSKANDLALTSDGKFIVVGTIANGTTTDTVVAKFTSTGALDTTFSSVGYKTYDLAVGANDNPTAVRVDAGGKIVVSGSAASVAYVLRLASTGAVDTTFGTNGLVKTAFGVGHRHRRRVDDRCRRPDPRGRRRRHQRPGRGPAAGRQRRL